MDRKYAWRRLGVVWLVVASLVLGVGLVVHDYNNMKYDEILGVNLVMIGEKKMAVIALRKEDSRSSFVILPPNMVAGDSDHGGKFRIGSLWGLGLIEGNPGERVMRNLTSELGLRLTAFIKVESDEDLNILGLSKAMIEVMDKTNLNWFDRISIRSKVLDLAEKGEISESMIPNNLFDQQVDPDGVENLIVDVVKEQLWAEKMWVIPAVLAEGTSMAVYNNSDTAGRGRAMAREMEVAGVKVVQIDKGGERQSKCRYTINGIGRPALARLLEKKYNCIKDGFQPSLGSERVDCEVLTGALP